MAVKVNMYFCNKVTITLIYCSLNVYSEIRILLQFNQTIGIQNCSPVCTTSKNTNIANIEHHVGSTDFHSFVYILKNHNFAIVRS